MVRCEETVDQHVCQVFTRTKQSPYTAGLQDRRTRSPSENRSIYIQSDFLEIQNNGSVTYVLCSEVDLADSKLDKLQKA